MSRFSQKTLVVAAIAIFFPLLLRGQNQPPQHPLDALKTQEYWVVYDVLRDSGKMGEGRSRTASCSTNLPRTKFSRGNPAIPYSAKPK